MKTTSRKGVRHLEILKLAENERMQEEARRRTFRILSALNNNSLGTVLADSKEDALAQFHAAMAPTVLSVYAVQLN